MSNGSIELNYEPNDKGINPELESWRKTYIPHLIETLTFIRDKYPYGLEVGLHVDRDGRFTISVGTPTGSHALASGTDIIAVIHAAAEKVKYTGGG